MADTNRLGLPFLAAAQAQKHVTVNDALRMLDGIVQATIFDTRPNPPAGQPAGRCFIVASGGTAEWTGWDGDIAMWADGTWYRIIAAEGFRVWDSSADELLVHTGGAWVSLAVAMGYLAQAASVDIAKGSGGGAVGMQVIEQTLSGLSGASVDSSVTIPNRAICLGVSTRTTVAVTGATSYDCGIAGEPSKFGGSLGAAQGSTNKGVIGPQAFYANTPIRLTANGADFTGGTVKIAIHLLTVGLPS